MYLCFFHSHLLLLSIWCCCSSVCPLCSTWKSHLHHLQFHPKMWVKNKVCYSFKVIAHHRNSEKKNNNNNSKSSRGVAAVNSISNIFRINFSVEKCLFGCVLLFHIRFVCISSPPKVHPHSPIALQPFLEFTPPILFIDELFLRISIVCFNCSHSFGLEVGLYCEKSLKFSFSL